MQWPTLEPWSWSDAEVKHKFNMSGIRRQAPTIGRVDAVGLLMLAEYLSMSFASVAGDQRGRDTVCRICGSPREQSLGRRGPVRAVPRSCPPIRLRDAGTIPAKGVRRMLLGWGDALARLACCTNVGRDAERRKPRRSSKTVDRRRHALRPWVSFSLRAVG